jgi:hypothetical protein
LHVTQRNMARHGYITTNNKKWSFTSNNTIIKNYI